MCRVFNFVFVNYFFSSFQITYYCWWFPSFSVIWTTAIPWSWPLPLIIFTDFRHSRLAAKAVCGKTRHHQLVNPLLRKPHWIPVKEGIIFKIATSAFRFFDSTLPPYQSACLVGLHSISYSPSWFWFWSQILSCARWTLQAFGQRAFSVQATLGLFHSLSNTN